MKLYNRDRGAAIMGTTGSVVVDRGGYEVYDLNGKMTDSFKLEEHTSTADTVGRDSMTDAHFANFIAAVRKGEALHAPIDVGNISVTMLQLSNVAWELGRTLHLDPADGKIQNDPEAMKQWSRTYEPGWEPKI